MAPSLLNQTGCTKSPRYRGQKVTVFGGREMKKSIILIVCATSIAAFAQAPATSSTTAPAAPGAATTPAVNTAVKPPAGTVVTSPAPAAAPKSPWGGLFVADVSRATDINHSKILDPENPDMRTDYSLALIGQLSYKLNPKNKYSLTETVTRDFVRNPADPAANEYSVKNMRFGWTRSTDLKLFGSGKIALPFSVALPTSYESRKAGSIASFRFKPSINWEFSPTYNLTWVFQSDATFTNPVNKEYAFDNIMEAGTLGLINSLSLGANITDTFSVSQSIGTTSKSKNLRRLTGMDQTGASLDLSTGVEWLPTPTLIIDAAVNQSAPLQGNGAGAVQVYDNNLFRLYHVAQTSYELTGTMLF